MLYNSFVHITWIIKTNILIYTKTVIYNNCLLWASCLQNWRSPCAISLLENLCTCIYFYTNLLYTLRKNSSLHCISSPQVGFCRYSNEWADGLQERDSGAQMQLTKVIFHSLDSHSNLDRTSCHLPVDLWSKFHLDLCKGIFRQKIYKSCLILSGAIC